MAQTLQLMVLSTGCGWNLSYIEFESIVDDQISDMHDKAIM